MISTVPPATHNDEQAPLGNPTALSGVAVARISTVPFFVVTQLKHQIEMLGRAGARVTVVSSDGPALAMLGGLSGVRCEVIDIPRSISPWRDVLALIRLFRFFRRQHIQIAHSTTPKAGLLTALAALLAGVPLRLHTYTGQPWVNMRGIKRWLARSSDRLIGRLNTRCYADSASQQQFLIEQGILDGARISVIGAGSLAGVDLARFSRNRFSAQDCASLRQSLNIPEGAPVLLFVGRITVDKGVRELLHAFALLKAGASDAHLVMVGQLDADSGVSGALAPAEIGRIRDTHIVGYSECPEAYLAIADVLCLPSYREGFGTVVIEAAAMGVATVGSNIYGLSDAVVHGETGILVPPRDAHALHRALQRLLENKELRLAMGAAAKLRAEKLFDAGKVNAALIKEYLDLLGTKN